jgi:hypothetical protein
VPRKHIDTIVDDGGAEHDVRLGVWLTNVKTWIHALPPERDSSTGSGCAGCQQVRSGADRW